MEVEIETVRAKETSSYHSMAAEEHSVPLGYKRTDVGIVPQDWGITRLGRICSMKSGIGITSASIDQFSTYPCFGGNGIRGFTDQFTHSGRFSLVGRQGALCGNIVRAKGKFFASEHAIVVTASIKTDSDWLFFALDRMQLNRFSESSAQPGLSVSKILVLPVACPPLLEQRAIAGALSDADALIESLEQLLTKKRQIKKGTMQELLTGKKRLPGFGGVWDKKRIGALFELKAGGDFDQSISSDEQNESFPYPIYANSVSQQGIYGFCNYPENQPGAITITARGTLGKALYRDTPFVAIGRLLVLKPRASMDARFFSEYINYGVNFAVESTGVPQLTAPRVAHYSVPVPIESEQTAIATILSDMDAEITAFEAKLSKAHLIKQGMMQELLTGRIRLL